MNLRLAISRGGGSGAALDGPGIGCPGTAPASTPGVFGRGGSGTALVGSWKGGSGTAPASTPAVFRRGGLRTPPTRAPLTIAPPNFAALPPCPSYFPRFLTTNRPPLRKPNQ